MPRRKHRRKYTPNAVCECPKGAVKVSTCSTKHGKKVCRGRGWGCLGTGLSKKGKPTPRWMPMICTEPEPARVPKQPPSIRAVLPPDVPQTIPPPRPRKKRKKLKHEVM